MRVQMIKPDSGRNQKSKRAQEQKAGWLDSTTPQRMPWPPHISKHLLPDRSRERAWQRVLGASLEINQSNRLESLETKLIVAVTSFFNRELVEQK